MFGLDFGELFVAGFILVTVLSTRYWSEVGGAIAAALARRGR